MKNSKLPAMTVTGGCIASRDDIEAALWRWSEWRADQRRVDELMDLIDHYAQQSAPSSSAGPDAGRAADDILARARREAEQIVQSARDEAAVIQSEAQKIPERPSTALTSLDQSTVGHDVWRDARGAVWVRLVPTPAITGERTKRCTECGVVKGELLFRSDGNAGGGLRSKCRDCENAKRRASRIKNKKSRR